MLNPLEGIRGYAGPFEIIKGHPTFFNHGVKLAPQTPSETIKEAKTLEALRDNAGYLKRGCISKIEQHCVHINTAGKLAMCGNEAQFVAITANKTTNDISIAGVYQFSQGEEATKEKIVLPGDPKDIPRLFKKGPFGQVQTERYLKQTIDGLIRFLTGHPGSLKIDRVQANMYLSRQLTSKPIPLF